MNTQLENTTALRDIHLPDAISWWPPAIGWWIVLAIIILAIFLLPKLYRYLIFIPLNKVSIDAFNKIEAEYTHHKNIVILTQSISKLLRQISMTYHGREKVACLTGDQWIDSLNSLTDKNYFSGTLKNALINAPYQKNIDVDPDKLLHSTKQWITALPKKINLKDKDPAPPLEKDV